MYFSKKSRFKPLFKQIIKLRSNIQNRKKLLNFKKKKWKYTIQFYRKKVKDYRNYQKFKPLDQTKYYVTRYSTRGTEYKKRFRDKLNSNRSFRLFYGGITYRVLQNKLKKIRNKKSSIDTKLEILNLFETRLDTVLYRAKFSTSLRASGQLITDGNVRVNGLKITTKSFQVKTGSIISLDPKCLKLYEVFAIRSMKWPLPPKHLIVNFKTMQILFIDQVQQTTLSTSFLFNLRLQKILTNWL